MKKTKILTPILTTASLVGIAITPLVSCSKDNVDKVTITFITNDGGTLKGNNELNVKKGILWKDVECPAIQAKEGKVFYGWFNNQSLMKSSDKIENNITLIAMFLTPTKQDRFEWNIDTFTHEATLSSLKKQETPVVNESIIVPTNVIIENKEYKVTKIKANAFAFDFNISSVTFPHSIIEIGESAFTNCSSLVHIDLPESIKYIGNKAFYYCHELKQIRFPNSIEYFGKQIAWSCEKLEAVDLPISLYIIPDSTFCDCKSLKNITLPTNLKVINSKAFSGCSSLEKFNVPKTVEEIGDEAFSLCTKLNKLVFQEGLISIGNKAFSTCIALKEVKFPNSLEIIGNEVFSGCKELESIILVEGLRNVGDFVFDGCSKITNDIVIPSTVKTMGMNPFIGTQIKSIQVAEGNTRFVSNETHTALFDNHETRLLIALTPIGFPATLTRIDGGAFAFNHELAEITIPSSVLSIGPRAFSFCTSLKKINFIPLINDVYSLRLIGDDAFSATKITNITIPDSVETIGQAAFANCSELATITLPKNLKTLSWNLFNNCSSLGGINNFENLKLSEISTYAFYGTILSAIYIHDTVDTIGQYIVGDKSNEYLKSIYINRSITQWPSNWQTSAFGKLDPQISAGTIYVPDQMTGDLVKQNWKQLSNWEIEIKK